MSLLMEEMARNELSVRHSAAERELRVLRILAARRWQRRADQASRRARLAAAAIR